MKLVRLLRVMLMALALTACASGNTISAQPAPTSVKPSQPTTAPASEPTAIAQATATPAPSPEGNAGIDLKRIDEQGAVVVQVTPLNLDNPIETVDFEVSMNTHSVDLGMNLAELATLTTDSVQNISATKWEAPGGGHHVSGKLLFPTRVNGKPLLQGATKLTLTLRNVDAPERVFTWALK